MIDINSLLDLLSQGIVSGFVLTLIFGGVAWGFWLVVRFFKNASRA